MSFLIPKKFKPQAPPTETPTNDPDTEEDGFVLVGQTEDERNAITPEKHNKNQDLPPMYQFSDTSREYAPPQASNQTTPPMYKETNTSDNTYQNYSNLHGQNSTAKSPVHDIPFKLDDSVACALNFGHVNVDIGDDFSWSTSQYDYDFTTERSVLQQSPF